MLNISRARVYDTTQWASLLSADGKKKNSGQFHLHPCNLCGATMYGNGRN